MTKFTAAFPELETEQALDQYYLDFHPEFEKDTDKAIVNFWKDILPAYQEQVQCSFVLDTKRAVEDFTLHDRVPMALETVVEHCM